MISLRLALAIVIVTIAASPAVSMAQEHGAEDESAEEAFHKNHLSVFTGGTTESSDGTTSTALSLGLDYERRVSRLVGLGLGGEFVFRVTSVRRWRACLSTFTRQAG